MREVHIGDEVWKYKIGKVFVVMRGPNNQKHLALRGKVGRRRIVWDRGRKNLLTSLRSNRLM